MSPPSIQFELKYPTLIRNLFDHMLLNSSKVQNKDMCAIGSTSYVLLPDSFNVHLTFTPPREIIQYFTENFRVTDARQSR